LRDSFPGRISQFSSARPLRLAEMVEVLTTNLDEELGFALEQRLPGPETLSLFVRVWSS
jgi:hypothetical protein